jgi:hypothetical protein
MALTLPTPLLRTGGPTLPALAAILSLALGGCLPLDDGPCDLVRVDCWDVCDTFCDGFGCYTRCFPQCTERCVVAPRDPETGERPCQADRDCARGFVCEDAICRPAGGGTDAGGGDDAGAGTGDGRVALFCAPCRRHEDCADRGALCIVTTDPDEGRCGLPCDEDAACPAPFKCEAVGERRQCIPRADACSAR